MVKLGFGNIVYKRINDFLMEERATVVYVGNFVTPRIKVLRGLPSWNPAGVNRMSRISEAIGSVGRRVIVLSTSTALRMKGGGGGVCRRTVERRNVAIVHATAVSAFLLNVILEPIFVAWQMFGLFRKRNVTAVVLYCFYPAQVAAALVAKIRGGVPIVLDLEDVSQIRVCDWVRKSETRALHQTVTWACMKMALALADSVIIPTERFRPIVGSKDIEVVTGCLNIPHDRTPATLPVDEIRVLYSGKVEYEHGINLLLDAVENLERNPRPDGISVRVDVCGTGQQYTWACANARERGLKQVEFHGFVSGERYEELLMNAHICVALQDPNGRHSAFKTPSKGYEYLSYGRATVITPVGDFPLLPKGVCILLNSYSGAELANVLRDILPSEIAKLGEAALTLSRRCWTPAIVGGRIERLFQRREKL